MNFTWEINAGNLLVSGVFGLVGLLIGLLVRQFLRTLGVEQKTLLDKMSKVSQDVHEMRGKVEELAAAVTKHEERFVEGNRRFTEIRDEQKSARSLVVEELRALKAEIARVEVLVLDIYRKGCPYVRDPHQGGAQ